MDDLKEAIIWKVNNSHATSAVELFGELLNLLYTLGYSEGQKYSQTRETDD